MRGMTSISALWCRLRWALLLIACNAVLNAQAQPITVPALTFTTVDGQTIRLSDLRGKIVLVNFWATNCSICRAEMPDLIQTYRQYHTRGLEVIAVAMSYDQPDLIKQYVAKHGLPFPVVWDTKGDIGRRFRDVQVTPTTFVVDKQGRLISRTLGIIDFERLRRFLEGTLSLRGRDTVITEFAPVKNHIWWQSKQVERGEFGPPRLINGSWRAHGREKPG